MDEKKDCLDMKLCNEMSDLVESLTTSGKPQLDAELMKKFKKICRTSDMYVNHAYHLLMTELSKPHSEIRLSSFQMINEVFSRSHAFRELLVSDFQTFLILTVETEYNLPLPPPKHAANALKTQALKAIEQWQEKYGEAYKKLALGYNFLKTCKKIDFDGIRARTHAEQKRDEEKNKKREAVLTKKREKVLKEMEDLSGDIHNCLVEIESCLSLLLPHPDEFFIADPELQSLSDDPKNKRTDQYDCSTNSRTSAGSETEKHIEISSSPQCPEKSDACSSDNSVNLNSEKDNLNKVSAVNSQLDHTPSAVTTTEDSSEKKLTNAVDCDNNKKESVRRTSVEGVSKQAQNDSGSDSSDDGSDDSDEEFVDSDDQCPGPGFVQSHGLGTRKYAINIDLTPKALCVKETEDNKDILNTTRELYKVIRDSYIPNVTYWLEALSKTGAKGDIIKKTIDMKVKLEEKMKKCHDLEIVSPESLKKKRKTDSSDDEDEFEEVEEKEGFEAVIPPHLKSEYGLTDENKASTSKNSPSKKLSDQSLTVSSWKITNQQRKEDVHDPTTMLANLKKLGKLGSEGNAKQYGSSSNNSSETHTSYNADGTIKLAGAETGSAPLGDERRGKKHALLEKAPFKPFGKDLEHWGHEDEIEAPLVDKYDGLSRFWTITNDDEGVVKNEDIEAVRNRTIPFVGKREEVKWKCRAPLANGKLCERMDRHKCPFHGRIIARDEFGIPRDEEEKKKMEKEKEASTSAADDWQDPKLQQDIEFALGVDLGSKTSKRKGKGKGKGKGKKKSKGSKYPNLTDIKEEQNTARNRLERKVFSRKAMKRVADTMNEVAFKRSRDKFGNQFNYALQ